MSTKELNDKKVNHLNALLDTYKDQYPNSGPNHPIVKFNEEFIKSLTA